LTERIIGDGYVKRSFEEWRDIVFRHDPEKVDPWWSSLAGDRWDQPNHVVDYLTRLCSDPMPALDGLTDAQINKGLWYLLGAWSDLYSTRVTTERSVACISAIYPLFEQVFATRCAPILSHLDEPGDNDLNSICYMWWDDIGLQVRRWDRERGEMDQAILDVLRRTLALPNIACQESALHGLGHNIRGYRDQIGGIIDEYLAANLGLHPGLRQYAENARIGHVQ
jgi:hypothetical protein